MHESQENELYFATKHEISTLVLELPKNGMQKLESFSG